MKFELHNLNTKKVMTFLKMPKSHKQVMKFDCNYLKKMFFNFHISSGLSVTSFRHIQRVIRSLKIWKKVLKNLEKGP